MANTTNYSWETPDDTDLVKDGAAAIRTLGTAIDTTVFNNASAAIAKTIVDAKGDLIVATAADTVSRLASSASNGDLLTVDTSTATGLKWSAPSGSGANWSLLNSGGTSLSGSTTTVSGISGKDKVMVLLRQASSTNATSQIRIRLNTDTGSNYYNFGAVSYLASTYSAGDFENSGAGSAFPGTEIRLGRMSSDTASQMDGVLSITGCNASGVKIYQYVGAANAPSGSSTQESRWGGGYYNSASTISSISIDCSTGTFDAGTVYVFTSAS
jgi:hypothetical protein